MMKIAKNIFAKDQFQNQLVESERVHDNMLQVLNDGCDDFEVPNELDKEQTIEFKVLYLDPKRNKDQRINPN